MAQRGRGAGGVGPPRGRRARGEGAGLLFRNPRPPRGWRCWSWACRTSRCRGWPSGSRSVRAGGGGHVRASSTAHAPSRPEHRGRRPTQATPPRPRTARAPRHTLHLLFTSSGLGKKMGSTSLNSPSIRVEPLAAVGRRRPCPHALEDRHNRVLERVDAALLCLEALGLFPRPLGDGALGRAEPENPGLRAWAAGGGGGAGKGL